MKLMEVSPDLFEPPIWLKKDHGLIVDMRPPMDSYGIIWWDGKDRNAEYYERNIQ